MVLSYQSLMHLGPSLIDPFDPSLVNPASIDIRIGNNYWFEDHGGKMTEARFDDHGGFLTVFPGDFILVSTLEKFRIPTNLAMELKLKSSKARLGFNHSLAFWFDPGWIGIGTMEITNLRRHTPLSLKKGSAFAQVIFHELDEHTARPYRGRYQEATRAEESK